MTNRTLALGGVFQAAMLVRTLAHDGRCDSDSFAASVRSVLKIDAANTAEVFGTAGGVRLGLEFLRDKLCASSQAIDVEVARYVISMLHLCGELGRHPAAQQAIRESLATIERQMKFFEPDLEPDAENVHPSLVQKLADLYVENVSTLAPRVIVTGEHGYLVNPTIAAKVRAALFAGIRAAFLWRQLGGRRWQLLFFRRQIAAIARGLLVS